ncbi:CoA-binding protein [Algoriphagus sp.]|uniref:CoA-binding protein n=1 Tax=Algoriphagus sp. TaxID=1872435 RepID=UPI0025F51F10|nr:CoA-binding protein [Algoriphagus sp.]
MSKKLTLLLGATDNRSKYSFVAADFLTKAQIPFIPISIHKGEVLGNKILDLQEKPLLEGVHTITVYLNKYHQKEWEEYLLSLNPKRIIFNPGAENNSFAMKANQMGIEVLNDCTLVMIKTGQY